MKNWLLITGLCLSGYIHAQSSSSAMREGDGHYRAQRFKEAEQQYRKAEDKNANKAYNLGNTMYQQGRFKEAEAQFKTATTQIMPTEHLADVYHNMGNAQMKQQQYANAIRSYEQSLRLRPGDAETKMNLQLAKKKLKQEQDKQQNNPDGSGEPPPQGQQPPPPKPQERPKPDKEQQATLDYINQQDQRNRQKYQEKDNKSSRKQQTKDW